MLARTWDPWLCPENGQEEANRNLVESQMWNPKVLTWVRHLKPGLILPPRVCIVVERPHNYRVTLTWAHLRIMYSVRSNHNTISQAMLQEILSRYAR